MSGSKLVGGVVASKLDRTRADDKSPIAGTPSGHFGVAANVKHSMFVQDIKRYFLISGGLVATACAAFGFALGFTYLLGAIGIANIGATSTAQPTKSTEAFYQDALFETRINPDNTLDVETSYTVNITEPAKFSRITQVLDQVSLEEQRLGYTAIRGFYKQGEREQQLGLSDGTLKLIKRSDGSVRALISEPGGYLAVGPQLFRSLIRVTGAVSTVKDGSVKEDTAKDDTAKDASESAVNYVVLSYNLNNLAKVGIGTVGVKHTPKQLANLNQPSFAYQASIEKYALVQGVDKGGQASGITVVLAESWPGSLVLRNVGGGVEYTVEFPQIVDVKPNESLILRERYKQVAP